MSHKTKTPRVPISEWLDLVISRADSLRKAGVSTISADGYSVSLLPISRVSAELSESFPELPQRAIAEEPEPEIDAIDDPMTYGGFLPGFDMSELRAELAKEKEQSDD